MEISGLPYLARASENVPFNAVISLDREVPLTPESVSAERMPGNQEASTLRELPSRDPKAVMHPSYTEAMEPQVMYNPITGTMRVASDRLNFPAPGLGPYEGLGHIINTWG